MASIQSAESSAEHNPAFARFAALAAMVVGSFVLAGWWFEIDALVNILPQWPRMPALAAGTFVVCGAALWCATNRHSKPAIVLSAVVVAIGLVLLAREFGASESDLDPLAAAQALPEPTSTAGMPPATAFGFLLLGLSLLFATLKRTSLPHQGLAIGCMLVAWVGLSRFMFGGEPLFAFANMAAHTALLFLLLCAGALTLRSESGIAALLVSSGVGGGMARRLLPAAIVVPLLAGALTVHYERRGSLGFESAVAIFALSSVIAIVAFVWLNAERADRADRERRKAENALRRSEEHNQLIVETSLDAVITMNSDGLITGWNGRAERMFGWPRGEAVGRELAELVIPESLREAHRAGLRRYVDSGVARVLNRRVELSAIHRDGREFPVELAIAPIGFGADLSFSAFIRDITTRVRAEAALRESEQRFRSTANAAPAMIWMRGPDKRCTWFNQRWLDFVGRSMEQELGDGWCDHLHAADFDRTLDTYHAAFDARRAYEIEYRLQREDGAWRWLLERGTPNFGPDGGFEGYLGTCIDITEHRETVEALRESRSRFKTLAESLPQMIWTCTRDGYTDYLSRQWLEYTGSSEAQQLGVGWLEQVHPEDRVRVQTEWARVIANGDVYDVSFRIRRFDGVYRWFKTRAVPLRDPANRILKWFGSHTDIEDFVVASARLNVQLERMQLLDRTTQAIGMHQEPDAVYEVVLRSLEENLGVEFCCICLYQAEPELLTVARVGERSRELAQQAGFAERTRIEVSGTSLARCVRGELIHETGAEEAQASLPGFLMAAGLRANIAAPLVIENEVFGVLIVGKREPDSFSDDDREFMRQLSRHVALASHQARLYGALQLAYQDLRQTQQTVMQQERLRALGQIASGIAHDINNALSPAALYTQSMLKHEPQLSARAREHLDVIQRAIEDVAETVQRMRAFYLPSGHELTLAPVDVNQILERVVELTRARWINMPQERGIVVQVDKQLAPDLPKILGAEREVRDAFTNLLLNAVDALPEGGTVTLRTRFDARDAQVIVEIQDDGLGMSETTRSRCLEPFFTTKGERGTGLGLPMVYGMLQRHGGELEIDSEPGRGSTMRLLFPQAPTGRDTRNHDMTRPKRPLRLLIIDDDPLLLRSLRDALELDGHEVHTAEGGQAGVDLFAGQRDSSPRFDAVFTDLGMPYVDGRQVAERIRQLDSAVPIIMLTGWGHRLAASAEKPQHVDRVLAKPPKMADLRATLAELVDGRDGGGD